LPTRALLFRAMTHHSSNKVRVWDLPTRLFHWTLACCVVGSVVSAKMGGNAMVWHFRLGYVVAALLLFRVVWGLIGGRWSRFASFIYAPGTLLAYWRGKLGPHGRWEVGHSPMGRFRCLRCWAWGCCKWPPVWSAMTTLRTSAP
jgi:cytochrome b